jgi:hypothetical protein
MSDYQMTEFKSTASAATDVYEDEMLRAGQMWNQVTENVKDSVEPFWFTFKPKPSMKPVAGGIMACAYVDPQTGKEAQSCCYVLFQSERKTHWWVASCRRSVATFRLISEDKFTDRFEIN